MHELFSFGIGFGKALVLNKHFNFLRFSDSLLFLNEPEFN